MIEKMLTGQIEMPEFIHALRTNDTLIQQLRELIPTDARYNREHPIWMQHAYSAVYPYKFDLYEYIVQFYRLDGTIGDNLNIFCTVKRFYSFVHPEIECTEKYHIAHKVYLNVTRDSFEGSEVNGVVQQIVQDALRLKTKSARVKYAKQEINLKFHVVDNKYPRWIQGPDWPMGVHSPMQFISRKRKGETVFYEFRDVDTGETRIVEQWY